MDDVRLAAHDETPLTLQYVPRSSWLLDTDSEAIGRLPDLFPRRYALLVEVGAPRTCFGCDLDYIRFVTFRFRALASSTSDE